MTNLIHRLESAEGPSRELDNEIYTYVLKTQVIKPGERPLTSDREYTPQYTTSLDAAVSLVPEGLAWLVRSRPPYACIWEPKGVGDKSWDTAVAATPAIALCIAALETSNANSN